MLGSVRRHMPLEITALAIEVHVADWAVHFIPAVVGRHVGVADVFVDEGFGAVGECAFEGAFGGGGDDGEVGCVGMFVVVVVIMEGWLWGMGEEEHRGEVFFGDVAHQSGFGGEVSGGAGLPQAFGYAFDEVDGFQVFLEVGAGGEGGATDGAAGHEPLAGAGGWGGGDGLEEVLGAGYGVGGGGWLRGWG